MRIQAAAGSVWMVWAMCAAKSGSRAAGAYAGRDVLPAGHVQIGDQRLRPMPLVFEFLTFDVTGLHGQRGVQTLQGLNAGHLIRPHHMRALGSQGGGGFIDLTHGADLLGQLDGVIGRRREPRALAMRLQRAHLLKNAPRCGEKSARGCRL